MTKEEVLKKIEKLYVMAERGTPEESKNALMLAKRLIAKYNIEQLEFNIDHGITEKDIETYITDIPGNINFYHDRLAKVVSDNYRCSTYLTLFHGDLKKVKKKRKGTYNKLKIAFAGLPTDLATCKMSFEFAFKLCQRSERRHYQAAYRIGEKYTLGTFTVGFVEGLSRAYDEQISSLILENKKYELVLLKPEALMSWEQQLESCENNYKRLSISNYDAYEEGKLKGYQFGSKKESISKGYELA